MLKSEGRNGKEGEEVRVRGRGGEKERGEKREKEGKDEGNKRREMGRERREWKR